ncbi:MAG: bifunctional diaminohydroxyphosphoribosylaminopyrimidine deaminase/5-amino-6-(5-phosphoribosylamino)uracil reductase RibD [Actinomycetota bacterium]
MSERDGSHDEDHERHMRRALELATLGRGLVSPNPMVGAVIVRDGRVVGEGWHEGPGTSHAEVRALAAAGDLARGATLYCTLEPCDHVGRTPPCTHAIVDSGLARAVVATGDPNPVVDGRGFERLRASGIEVETGVLEDASLRLNAAFERHVLTGLPLVTLKTAASLDGKTAARDRSSKWITGDAAREDVQRLRAAADAIVVGAGTVIDDDPSLTVRDPSYRGRPPIRVVVDASGRVAAGARVFDGSAPTFVATTSRAGRGTVEAWTATGADVVSFDRDETQGVSLPELLAHLGKRDVQGVLLEGGATLAWSFVRERLIDRVVLYLAPKLVGGAQAPGVLMGEGFAPIGGAAALRIVSVERVGDDLRVEADVHRDR